MVISASIDTGTPTRIYRSLSEIKRDINLIKERIFLTDERINIRALLLELLSSARCFSPEVLIPELKEAIDEANDALELLLRLREELSALEEEMEETVCVIGR